jgi:hypothetical protein
MVGQYRGACTATANGQCVPCTVKPPYSTFVSAGRPYGADACDWRCNTGYFKSSQTCRPCSTLTCPTGQYSTVCTATADSVCTSCTNLQTNGVYTSAGQLGDPASCQTGCVSGFFKVGRVCLACDTSSCPVGQYRSACTASADGQCVSCTKAPPNARYVSGGKPYGADACDWACNTGFYRNSGTCGVCSTSTCPTGQYRTLCRSDSDSQCRSCTNVPSNGVYVGPGNVNDPLSCPTACVVGYFKVGSSCVACDTTSCSVGYYRSACTASANGQCTYCTTAPANARYTSAGKPYGADACDWSCRTGYYLSGSSCVPCSNPTCPTGQYATVCTPTANSVCQSCTNLPANGVYTGAGQRGDPNSCQTGCQTGFWKQGSRCVACTTTSCAVGQYRGACTATSDGQCMYCTNAPAYSQYSSAGTPYNANTCSWTCRTGYYISGTTCASCSSPSCPVGKYATTCTPTANSVCQSCTNLPANGVYTGAGQRGDPNSCQTGCNTGFWKQGTACVACTTTSCAVGQYRGACSASADGRCVSCTNAPWNSQYTSAGSPYNANACSWACSTGYYLSGSRCAACSSLYCPVGKYATICTSTADSSCQPCTNLPAYGRYTSAGRRGDPNSCDTRCQTGYYREGAGCSSCQNLVFSVKPGGDNYADCDGTYVIDSRTVNGKPLYINQAKYRFLAYSSSGAWVVTGLQWLDGILGGGSFGGFHGNGGADPMAGWANYRVRKPAAC